MRGKNICKLPILLFAPEMAIVARINKLYVDIYAISPLRYPPDDNSLYIELVADCLRIRGARLRV